MKVLLSWLREFAPLDADPVALGDAMAALGTPVESMERIGEALAGVIVAQVVALRPHPDADRVQLVDVDTGSGDLLQIVCGAFNVHVGDHVPLATVGTVMPNGMDVARRNMRGEWSNGMLCSAAELRLGGDAGGILILAEDTVLGTSLREALGFADDILYDLEVNPNRPDAMSVAGIARDLAAHFGVLFARPIPSVTEDAGAAATDLAKVEILDPDLCGRFVARVIQGVTVGPSPRWLANRLTLLGMRPINNVVDVSNYVMLEHGQPNHPYDLNRLAGPGIRVRRARRGETLVTLDDVERSFTTDDLLICDGDDKAIGVAGVMGGASTEIAADTTDVLLEMAWFQPMAVAKTARRIGARSEASARFEKGCDPEVIDLAAARFIELLGEMSPGAAAAAGTIDERGVLPERVPVRLRTARVNSILGTALIPEEVAGYLTPIGFGVVGVGGGDHDVLIPSFRPDCEVEIDLVEEVARHHGYARIGRTTPPFARAGGLTVRQHERRALRHVLAASGYAEAMPLPFLAPGDLERSGLPGGAITITNPLVAEESVLRTSLLPGMLRAIAYNESHRNEGVALFEIGHVFRVPPSAAPLPDEREHVAVAVAGRDAAAAVEAWAVIEEALAVPDARLEADVIAGMHPTRTARIVVGRDTVGAVGEVDPSVLDAHEITERVAWLELNLDLLLSLPHGERPYRLVSRYPSSDIDLAFEVSDDVAAGDVERTLRDAAGPLLAHIELFDVFRGAQVGEGRRSLAFALRLQAADRTLTDADVAAVRLNCITAVESTLPARLRG